MDFPERLKRKEGDEEHEEDVVPFSLGQGYHSFVNMNTNILGLMSAAGPKVDYHSRFTGYSSEEDANESGDEDASRKKQDNITADPMAQTMVLSKPSPNSGKRHSRRSSGHKLMQSVPILSKLSSKRSKKSGKKPELHIQESSEPESSADENRLAPHMSRILEARAEVTARPSFDLERRPTDREQKTTERSEGKTTDLSRQLQEIFEFDEPEEVISGEDDRSTVEKCKTLIIVIEYPCYLLQAVLLQGFIYITSKHICFYAYLPKKAVSEPVIDLHSVLLTNYQHETTKTGYLSKAGKRNPRYNRYWFQLKGDVLSYYEGTANKYFPHGQIDLRYGITATVTDKDKDKDAVHFTVETDNRTYYFRADTPQSAKEWVKSLQRVIFRSRNEGDSVKISLPIRNVLDIEEIQVLDLADTCKIRVVDNGETYVVDEVRVAPSLNVSAEWLLIPNSTFSRSLNTAKTLSTFSKFSLRMNMLMTRLENSRPHLHLGRLLR